MLISVNDIQKLGKFIMNNVNSSEVDKLGNESPIDLLIRAVYGKIECEELEKNKTKFDESFIYFYSYLIIAIHRVLFEQNGKCVKQLLDIANYLNPHTTDFSILLRFYERVYEIMKEGKIKNKKELYKMYQEFKDYLTDDFKTLISPKIIKAVLAYLGVKDIHANDITFEDESYVHYNDINVPLEEMIERFGLVYVGIRDEEILLSYYRTWFHRAKRDIEKSRKSKRNLFLTYIKKFFL